MCSRIQSISARVLGVGLVARAPRRSPAIWSSSACSRARWRLGGVARRPRPRRPAVTRLDLRGLVGLELLVGPTRLARRRRRARAARSCSAWRRSARRSALRFGLLPLALDGLAMDLRGCGRTPRSRTAAAAAARRRAARPPPACGSTSSRSAPRARVRYSSSSRDSSSSGASRRQAVDDDAARPRAAGSRPGSSRMSSLSRRTMTSSSAFLPRTFTPRVKRVRVEELEQRREAVGVAVVRRGREEQPVLEARRRGRGSRG